VDVVLSAASSAAAASEIGAILGSKGFCVVDPCLEAEVFREASKEAEAFSESLSFTPPPSLVCEGLLGSEGSSQILHMEKLAPAEAPSLRRIDHALNELANLIGGDAAYPMGFQCRWRTHALLHETGMPSEVMPALTEHEAASWLASFSRAKLMMLAILGPIAGTLELDPFDEETEPFEFHTTPGTIVLLRADLMSHKHFAHSRAFVLSSFLFSGRTASRKGEAVTNANMPPCAIELENWAVQRLRELKEEEIETGRTVAIPDGWRSAMDRMFHMEQRCAIRGISGRFCSSWNVVDWCSGQLGGTDFVTHVPLKRWDCDRYFDPDPEAWRQGKTYLNHSSFCDGVELFDCRFFGLSPMEAAGMDPHQRQVLEVGYEACFRAGYKKGKLMNCLGGVYLGSTFTIYSMVSEVGGATGGAASINSNRFSYCLGMKGPSMTVDTEGASSLSAVYLGADAVLEKGRGVVNAFSLAGGVYYSLGTIFWPQMQVAGLLSSTGRCLSWDESADGHCFGDGCGFVVQKRLTDNVDGQRVFIEGEPLEGVIASAAMNSSGMAASMSAPSGPSDQELVAEACRNANVSGANVDSVECDGRGGFMGDAVEVDSLARVLRGAFAEEVVPLALGSTKSRMGHGAEAAGIASLLRVIVGNRFGLASPNCHLRKLNPYMEREHRVNYTTELGDFAYDSMYCGVTAKGFGGTNVHVLTFGQPDSALVDRDASERKLGQLWFWPGGGGELEDAEVPARGYYIVGSWSRWEPEKMEQDGGDSYSYTVTLGENLWEDFQILLDADPQRRLHPEWPRATSGSAVWGPEAAGKGLYWRIAGRGAAAAMSDARDGGGGSTEVGGAVSSTDDGQVGAKYRARLKICGKYRTVTWEKLDQAPNPSRAAAGSYYIASNWNGWSFDEMVRDGDEWYLEALMLRSGAEFQVVRNMDWGQVIRPRKPEASQDDRGVGPDEAWSAQGRNWQIDAAPGDVMRISLRREEVGGEWSVSWQRRRREELSEEQVAEASRLKLGVAGSWTDFAQQQPLVYEGTGLFRVTYGFLVEIGEEASESFQLLLDQSWGRLVHPDRYVLGASMSHRVLESVNDGSALDLVWTIDEAADGAKPGDVFHVSVETSKDRVLRVTWEPASSHLLTTAIASGRSIFRTKPF